MNVDPAPATPDPQSRSTASGQVRATLAVTIDLRTMWSAVAEQRDDTAFARSETQALSATLPHARKRRRRCTLPAHSTWHREITRQSLPRCRDATHSCPSACWARTGNTGTATGGPAGPPRSSLAHPVTPQVFRRVWFHQHAQRPARRPKFGFHTALPSW